MRKYHHQIRRVAVALIAAIFCACGPGSYHKDESGLQWRDEQIGEGAEPQIGDVLKLHYTGKTLVGGQEVEFFDSHKRKTPVTLPYLEDRLIKGFVIGLKGMRPGGKRSLIVPPELGYGKDGAGQVIPPDATLYFVMELIEIKKAASAWEIDPKAPVGRSQGYEYIVLDPGEGTSPGPGEYVMVKYHKYSADGRLLDTSDYYASPYEFHVGQPEVPPSWNVVVPLMKPRARYRIVVPPAKLPAEEQAGLPGKAPLVQGMYYDLELLGVEQNHLHE